MQEGAGGDSGISQYYAAPAGSMKQENVSHCTLKKELKEYQRRGIQLELEGEKSTYREILKACQIQEEGSYMRDYIQNEKGEIDRVQFNFVKEE